MEDLQHQQIIYDSRQADPTVLTTQLMQRELAALKEILETRLEGMDKAIELLQVSTSKLPSMIDEKVKHLKELHEETFRSIEKSFSSVTILANQVTTSGKESLALALQAQKESAGEAKSQSEKSIDKMEKQSETAMAVRDVKIEGLTARVALMEGRGAGMTSSWQILTGALGAAAIVGGLLWAAIK